MLNKLTGHDTGPQQSTGTTAVLCGKKGRGVVEACWFTALVYLTITVHVTLSIVSLALNWHGHHLDENFFHENIYFVLANGFFCLVYGIEIILSVKRSCSNLVSTQCCVYHVASCINNFEFFHKMKLILRHVEIGLHNIIVCVEWGVWPFKIEKENFSLWKIF